MSSNNLKTVTIKDDKIVVNEENEEIPKDSIIHCLGSLFKFTDSGLNHVVRKIDENTYFTCLLYTSPSPRDATLSRMPSSA